MTDFFVSYTRPDREWAVWIAWVLEAAGYSSVVQAWDFRPGANFAIGMQKAMAESERTVAVLSPDYLESRFTAPEWAAAFVRDPTGENGLLLPIRVREVELEGLLPQIVYIDLVGLDETEAEKALLSGVKRGRIKPDERPFFPGEAKAATPSTPRPLFPGEEPVDGVSLSQRLRSASGEAVGRSAPWPGAAWWRAGIAAALVVALAIWLALESWRRAPGNGADKPPRLAVLPFEDLGAPENAYFAAGMTEELIGGLAALHGLQVISRTTITQYSRAGKKLHEIGRDLGVDYVLEGTVRWDRARPGRDRVRITPRLIRVSDDTHLWSDEYDRDLADVFAVQSDIARHVVRALGVTLSARERRLVEVPPTRNPEAYQLYLRGLQMLNSRIANSFGSNLLDGADLMHRAAELDPRFGRAHAREASALAYNYFLGGPAENRERALAALERAQAVAPDDPRVRLGAGWVYYHGARDYRRALLEFEAAGRAMPSNELVPYAIGSVLRRLGRYDEALDRFARASELGTPEGIASWFIDRDSAVTNWALRRYPEADRLYERCLRVAPDESTLWSERTVLQLHWKGDTTAARAALADAPPTLETQLVETRVLIELWDRRFAAVLAVASAQPRLDPRSHRRLEWYVAYAYLRLGRSQEGADLARRLIATRVEGLAANPKSGLLHESLAETYALLGVREPALAHARMAVALVADDALRGPQAVETLALVHTLLGEREQALALLPGLLEKAYDMPLDSPRLRREPWWDLLRGDPRFGRLLARTAASSPPPGVRTSQAH